MSDINKQLRACQEYQYSQSSKVSTISRNIVFGEIGTICLVVYTGNTTIIQNPCGCLIIALFLNFFYLLVDLLHYFIDTCYYRLEYYRLDRDRAVEGIHFRHLEFMNIVSRRSFRMLIIKFAMVIIISVVFLIGMLIQFKMI